MVFPLELVPPVEEKLLSDIATNLSFGGWLRRPGGQGGFRPPPYAPLDPLYPLQTAEGYPRTPLVPEGALPLVSRPTGSVSGTPFGLALGPATNRVPGRARTLHGTRCRGAYCCKVVLPWRSLADTPRINRRRGAGGGISCAEGDSGPPRDGREPSWARPCEASGALLLSNGGSGGGHAACTLWPPPAPFGYFPARGKYLVRPQADETSPQQQAPTPTKAPSSPHPPSTHKSRAPASGSTASHTNSWKLQH